jgi:hypothetical protein
MSAMEKSDLPEVARKRANKVASAATESTQRRARPRRMRTSKARSGRRARKPRHAAQARIQEAATRNRQGMLPALLPHPRARVTAGSGRSAAIDSDRLSHSACSTRGRPPRAAQIGRHRA